MLKSVLRSHQLKLALKALVFAGCLVLVKFSGFGLLPAIFFLIIASILYIRPIFQTFHYLPPFLILLVTGLLWINYLPSKYAILGILALTVLFYILLGVKNLVLIDRIWANWLLHLGLIYLIVLVFFLLSPDQWFLLKLLGLFFALTFLLEGIVKGRRIWSIVPAFLLTEAAVGIRLLPIGFLQATNAMFIVVWSLTSLVLKYRQKNLTRREVLKNLTLSGILLLIIFITSRWKI